MIYIGAILNSHLQAPPEGQAASKEKDYHDQVRGKI